MTTEKAHTSYAPNYDVPENVSPFVPLPMLALCSACGGPVEPLMLMSVVRGGRVQRDLCPTCADSGNPPAGGQS